MSALTREVIFEELGLMPVWTRRELLQAESAVVAAAEPAVELAPAPAPAPAPTAVPARPEISPPSRRTGPVEKVEDAPAPALDRDARARTIAQMDWESLKTAVADCTACGLCQSRSQTVFGVGLPDADWLVVGEAPGAEEDKQGEPFVGQAGKLLDNMLAAVDHSRKENVFILNTLKCRPPQNRNPDPSELALCAPFLHRQIELIKPKVILATGRFAVQVLLEREASISSLRGKVHDYRGIPVVVTYHPAYLLRNMPDKIKSWQDLVLARKVLERGRQ